MKIKKILDGFHNGIVIYPEVIALIRSGGERRKEFVNYFIKNKDREFALAILDKFIEIRKQPDGEMPFEDLMLACYIVGLHGCVADCLKIWEAKEADFDTWCGLDSELMLFAGIQQTHDFLSRQKSDEAMKALERLEYIDDLEGYFSATQLPWYI